MDVLNYVQTNTAILNVLWSLTCGRKMHAQQQEFQVRFFLLKKKLWFYLCKLTKQLQKYVSINH
jgi:hypothetical protein